MASWLEHAISRIKDFLQCKGWDEQQMRHFSIPRPLKVKSIEIQSRYLWLFIVDVGGKKHTTYSQLRPPLNCSFDHEHPSLSQWWNAGHPFLFAKTCDSIVEFVPLGFSYCQTLSNSLLSSLVSRYMVTKQKCISLELRENGLRNKHHGTGEDRNHINWVFFFRIRLHHQKHMFPFARIPSLIQNPPAGNSVISLSRVHLSTLFQHSVLVCIYDLCISFLDGMQHVRWTLFGIHTHTVLELEKH